MQTPAPMGEDWRKHLESQDDGTVRIKAHGKMNVDARIVTDQQHLSNHIDDRGPEQLVNAAELPGTSILLLRCCWSVTIRASTFIFPWAFILTVPSSSDSRWSRQSSPMDAGVCIYL